MSREGSSEPDGCREAEVNVTKAKRKAAKDEDKLRGLKDAARNETNPVKLLQKIAAQQQNLTDIAEAENKRQRQKMVSGN